MTVAPDRFVDLRRLAEAATPGPWKSDAMYAVAEVPGGRPGGEVIVRCGPTVASLRGKTPDRENAAYIAAANPSVILALLSERQELADSVDEQADVIGSQQRRIAALEEWLRAIVAEDYRGNEPSWYRKARSLLSEADATTSVKAQPSLSERSDLSSSGGTDE